MSVVSDTDDAEDIIDGTLKPKIWRAQVVQDFMDNLLLRSSLEIVEGGETLRMCEIHSQLFDRYHARIENTSLHKRPDELMHPQKLLECTAFRSQKEWDAWKKESHVGSGKCQSSDQQAGLLNEARASWAAKKWEKYKLLKREIHDQTQRLWSALVPNNNLPSGVQKINDLVEKLRGQMFDVWKFAKTSTKSTVRYSNQEMKGPCADWHPTWWAVWKAMGPAAGGNCSATFMSEVGMKSTTSAEPMPSLLAAHFETQKSLLSGSANFLLKSKKDIQREAHAKLAAEAHIVPATPSDSAFESRSRTMDNKSRMDIRKQEIQRLQFLHESPFATAAQKLEYGKELFVFMQSPVVPSLSFAASKIEPCTLVFGNDLSTSLPATDMVPCCSEFQDATAIGFAPMEAAFRQRDALLMPIHHHFSPPPVSIDYAEEERRVMQLQHGCDSLDFVDSLFVDSMGSSDFLDSNADILDSNADILGSNICSSDFEPKLNCNIYKSPFKSSFGDGKNCQFDLTVHQVPGDGACCISCILASWRRLRDRDPHFMKEFEMPDSLEFRGCVVNWMKLHCDTPCPALGFQSIREGVTYDYIRGGRELRDSDYIRAAMEADENSKQIVHSFFGYTTAMRQPHAYCDEFFISAAAMFIQGQICVIRDVLGKLTPTFYQHPDSKFRICLINRGDHYDWCYPEVDMDDLECITIDWNPPPLVTGASEAMQEKGVDIQLLSDNFLDSCSISGPHTEEDWFMAVEDTWKLHSFSRRGVHSFFEALVSWLNSNSHVDRTLQSVRLDISKYIKRVRGRFHDLEGFDVYGFITLDCLETGLGSDRSARRFSLENYCSGISDDFTAGDIEIRAASELYKIRIIVYEHGEEVSKNFDARDPGHISFPECKMVRRKNAKGTGCISKNLDSYFLVAERLILSPFKVHEKMMRNIPEWNVDLEVAYIDDTVGRGIRALRPFAKHSVAGIYDGHRCDLQGNLVIPRLSVLQVFQLHPQLNRHMPNGSNFQDSHSVSLGRNHCSGLLIDGHPLCDPVLDGDINSLGRFALANAASSDAAGTTDRYIIFILFIYFFCSQQTSSSDGYQLQICHAIRSITLQIANASLCAPNRFNLERNLYGTTQFNTTYPRKNLPPHTQLLKPRLHLLLLLSMPRLLAPKPTLQLQPRRVQLPPTLPKLSLKPRLHLLLLLLPTVLVPKQTLLSRRVVLPPTLPKLSLKPRLHLLLLLLPTVLVPKQTLLPRVVLPPTLPKLSLKPRLHLLLLLSMPRLLAPKPTLQLQPRRVQLPPTLPNLSLKPRLHLLLLLLPTVLVPKSTLLSRRVVLPPTLPKLSLKPRLDLILIVFALAETSV
jgi:hypothetical protein